MQIHGNNFNKKTRGFQSSLGGIFILISSLSWPTSQLLAKSILDIQPFAMTQKVEISNDKNKPSQSVRFINLNPHQNHWYVIGVTWKKGEKEAKNREQIDIGNHIARKWKWRMVSDRGQRHRNHQHSDDQHPRRNGKHNA